jgi:uncharacterized protein YceK
MIGVNGDMAKRDYIIIITMLILSGCAQSHSVSDRGAPAGGTATSRYLAGRDQNATQVYCAERSGAAVLTTAILSGEVGSVSVH